MRVHAGQLSLLEVDELPKDETSKATVERGTTGRDSPRQTCRKRQPSRAPGSCEAFIVRVVTNAAALLTTNEAAVLLHVHARTVQRLVERGDLSAVHLGGAVRFDPHDVQSLIERVKSRPVKPTRVDAIRSRSRAFRPIVPSGSFRDRIGSSRS